MKQIKINIDKISDFDLKLAKNPRVIAAIDEILSLSLDERTVRLHNLRQQIADGKASLFEERVLTRLLEQRTAEWIKLLQKNLSIIEQELQKRHPPQPPALSFDAEMPEVSESPSKVQETSHAELLDFLATQKPPTPRIPSNIRKKSLPKQQESFLRRHAKDVILASLAGILLIGAFLYALFSQPEAPTIETFDQEARHESPEVKAIHEEIQNRYDAAAYQLRFGSFENGKRMLLELVKEYPTGEHAENAYVLLGDVYRQRQRDPDQALKYYQLALEKFPSNPQTGMTQLKMGFAYEDLHDLPQAKEFYRLLVSRYSDTSRVGQAARARLASLENTRQ
ncbi:tol-pal system protein YbgF [Candidatus Moduliflexus flocculans]|uniref:Tol-pal system protein YbgF n=1 Tax=Candidatus Moduliflexus flocculans TaxID=1499966 RepID=A0A081BST8_9BACT|nr:tol-pal system protein YbgF [Candidatus Moduliflexus flocculans]